MSGGVYVPPWKRAQTQVDGASPPARRTLEALTAQTPPVSTFTLQEFERTFGIKQGTLTPFTYHQWRSDSPQSLPDSPVPAHPLERLICYVTHFPHAHPDWPNALLFHTNAELVDNDLNIGRPLPCIKQVINGGRRVFEFYSWIKITAVRKLDPVNVVNDKEELIDLLRQKEKDGLYKEGRPQKVWNEALDTTWIMASVVPVAGLENPFKPLDENSLRYVEDRAEEYVQKVTTPM